MVEDRLETRNEAGERSELAGAEPGLSAKGVAAFVAGWLVPGAGHFLTMRWKRGFLLSTTLIATFLVGLSLHGRLGTFDEANLLSIVFVFADVGSGLLYLVCLLAKVGLSTQAQTSTFEYGTSLLHVVGLLNYLVALDAYDIAAGRKR
jgi:hypothetical protein